ncbi:MAG: hydantoin racemase [Chloroflexi bacterium]|nr:hydantoin racemase [Chloroflexota bacterium]
MKILWDEATSGAPELQPLWRILREYFPKIASPGNDVTMRHAAVSGNYIRSLYTELLNNRSVVETAIQGEKDGFDGVVIGCWADPLWEAREAVNIPVVGIGEASMLLACSLGYKFAIITVAPGVVPTIELDLHMYGMQDRAIYRPVRYLNPASDVELLLESIDDPQRRLIPNFERVARECINDGAEVIIVGCGYYGPILSMHGYNEIPGTGVPVLDCSAAGLKMAEALIDLRRSIGLRKSTALFYKNPPAEVIERIRKVHGLN